MNKNFGLSRRKGQSAIEYLMTYGWMLLVVAIVGGAIFATVQDTQQSCEKQIVDVESSNQGFGVSDFTTTSEDLNIQFENNQRDTATLEEVNISGVEVTDTTEGGTLPVEVGFGDTVTLTTTQIAQSENCATLDIEVSYTVGDLPSELTGSLQENMATVS